MGIGIFPGTRGVQIDHAGRKSRHSVSKDFLGRGQLHERTSSADFSLHYERHGSAVGVLRRGAGAQRSVGASHESTCEGKTAGERLRVVQIL